MLMDNYSHDNKPCTLVSVYGFDMQFGFDHRFRMTTADKRLTNRFPKPTNDKRSIKKEVQCL